MARTGLNGRSRAAFCAEWNKVHCILYFLQYGTRLITMVLCTDCSSVGHQVIFSWLRWSVFCLSSVNCFSGLVSKLALILWSRTYGSIVQVPIFYDLAHKDKERNWGGKILGRKKKNNLFHYRLGSLMLSFSIYTSLSLGSCAVFWTPSSHATLFDLANFVDAAICSGWLKTKTSMTPSSIQHMRSCLLNQQLKISIQNVPLEILPQNV